jgi:hypothetical protein
MVDICPKIQYLNELINIPHHLGNDDEIFVLQDDKIYSLLHKKHTIDNRYGIVDLKSILGE